MIRFYREKAGLILALVLAVGLWQAEARADKAYNCYRGACPLYYPTTPQGVEVDRQAYTLYYDGTTKMAGWVAYQIFEGSLSDDTRRNNYVLDPYLRSQKVEQLSDSDYDGIGDYGYARGHQAPYASLAGEDGAETEVNYVSNLTPQLQTFNNGMWKALEEAERNLVESGDYDFIHSVTGPIYDTASNPALILFTPKSYKIPVGYWKVIIAEDGSTAQLAAFVFPSAQAAVNQKTQTDQNNVQRLKANKPKPTLKDFVAVRGQTADFYCNYGLPQKNNSGQSVNPITIIYQMTNILPITVSGVPDKINNNTLPNSSKLMQELGCS